MVRRRKVTDPPLNLSPMHAVSPRWRWQEGMSLLAGATALLGARHIRLAAVPGRILSLTWCVPCRHLPCPPRVLAGHDGLCPSHGSSVKGCLPATTLIRLGPLSRQPPAASTLEGIWELHGGGQASDGGVAPDATFYESAEALLAGGPSCTFVAGGCRAKADRPLLQVDVCPPASLVLRPAA